jgi:SAM-dependent methyltransferase
MSNVLPIALPKARTARRRVLHVGCGYPSAHRLHAAFRAGGDWQEIRLDIDAKVQPDIVCSTVDMSASVPNGSVDAVWSSHTVEHLYDHEVAAAFAEFHRVLNPNGFLLLRCPDLEAVAESILGNGIEHVAYESPAGPVTPLDILYGYRPSIAAGNLFMAHRTGFTDERIGRMLLEAGFAEARTKRTEGFDLWAVAFTARGGVSDGLDRLARSGLDFDG